MELPSWVVTSATPHADHTIDLGFADGKVGVFDCKPLLSQDIYAPLRNVDLFLQAHLACGTVVWSDTLDIAPEFLYEHCTAPAETDEPAG